MRRDLFLIERDDPRPRSTRSSRWSPRGCPSTTASTRSTTSRCSRRCTRGALGIDALNAALRDALNPHGEPVLGGRLRIGDKLMLVGRNLHELGLMNGTMLRLLERARTTATR